MAARNDWGMTDPCWPYGVCFFFTNLSSLFPLDEVFFYWFYSCCRNQGWIRLLVRLNNMSQPHYLFNMNAHNNYHKFWTGVGLLFENKCAFRSLGWTAVDVHSRHWLYIRSKMLNRLGGKCQRKSSWDNNFLNCYFHEFI